MRNRKFQNELLEYGRKGNLKEALKIAKKKLELMETGFPEGGQENNSRKVQQWQGVGDRIHPQ